ncbi:TadE family protein [Microbacterium sp. H83]|uniref:TadE family protein n=1 Tax=Microbacterium sp. H83 TaxID=1827324 RepID=UPI0007F4D22B|nr:TadE family protein [Microbacterium sp. H83]OAN37433.1 TadE family protein [Microbacterium sp. H83]
MTDDDGSAALEFITVGVILLVPLVYLIIALGAIQEQVLGVEAAARHTLRAVALAPDAAAAASASDAVIESVLAEYGVDAETAEVSVTCAPLDAPCPAPGALVTLTVSARVRLPLIPSIVGLDQAAAIGIEGEAVQKMSRLWGTG